MNFQGSKDILSRQGTGDFTPPKYGRLSIWGSCSAKDYVIGWINPVTEGIAGSWTSTSDCGLRNTLRLVKMSGSNIDVDQGRPYRRGCA